MQTLISTAVVIFVSGVSFAASWSEPVFQSLTLERTQCYGACPAYAVRILSTGYVQYEGLQFVRVQGHRTKQLTATQLKELETELRHIKLLDLRDSYVSQDDGCPVVWTDSPSAIITLRVGYQVKVVNHYFGCRERSKSDFGESYPPGLERFESRIDEIVGTREWVVDPAAK